LSFNRVKPWKGLKHKKRVLRFMKLLSKEEGEFLVREARRVIEKKFGRMNAIEEKVPELFFEKRGVFVTLYKNKELRGCIGYPYPVLPLIEAVRKAAVAAAFQDPRFPSLHEEELKEVKIEVTVLTVPEKINAHGKELVKHVEVGKHGLIAEWNGFSGLLLPQVAVEEGWDAETFLAQTCWKAGLEPSKWIDPDVTFYRFEGQIFEEEKPEGSIVEKKIK